MEEINNQSGLSRILPPNYNISLHLQSDECTDQGGLFGSIKLINDKKVVAIIGADYSRISMQASLIAGSYHVPIISGSSTNAKLSNKSIYPTFLRTAPPDSQQGTVLAQVMMDLGWRRVGILCGSDPYTADLAGNIQSGCVEKGIDVKAFYTFDALTVGSSMDPSTVEIIRNYLLSFKREGIRIIVLSVYPPEAQYVIREAITLNMVGPSSDYIFIGVDAWMQGQFFDTQGKEDPDMIQYGNGFLGIIPDSGDGTAEYRAFVSRFTNSATVAKTLPAAEVTNIYTSLYYDIPYVLAHSFKELIALNITNPASQSIDVLDKLLDVLLHPREHVRGVTGKVVFDSNGDRVGDYGVYSFQNGQVVRVGRADTTYSNLDLPAIQWPSKDGGIPRDEIMSIREPNNVLKPMLWSLGTVGLLYTLICVAVVILYRKSYLIKASSPTFTLILASSSLIGCIATFLYGLTPSLEVCRVRLITGLLSITIMLSTLVATSIRLFALFEQKEIKRKTFGNWKVALYILIFLSIEVAILVTAAFMNRLPTLSETLVLSDDYDRYILYYCKDDLTFLMYQGAYIVILTVMSLLMAWFTRNVPLGFSESEALFRVAKTMGVFVMLVIPVLYFIPSGDASTLLQGISIWAISISTLSIIFFPKIRIIYAGMHDDEDLLRHGVKGITGVVAPLGTAPHRSNGPASPGSVASVEGGPLRGGGIQ